MYCDYFTLWCFCYAFHFVKREETSKSSFESNVRSWMLLLTLPPPPPMRSFSYPYLLTSFYRLRGSPTEDTWPGVSKLPEYKVLSLNPTNLNSMLKPKLDTCTFSLKQIPSMISKHPKMTYCRGFDSRLEEVRFQFEQRKLNEARSSSLSKNLPYQKALFEINDSFALVEIRFFFGLKIVVLLFLFKAISKLRLKSP